MVSLQARWTLFKLNLSCKLWDLRGLTTCPYHGFHSQSLLTGYCKECGEIPVLPPMDEMCTFCEKEKAIKQIADPNGLKKVWSVCWECDKFIEWSELDAMNKRFTAHFGKEPKELKPFDKWLFDLYKVYPKGEYYSATLKKKEEKNES